MKRMYLTAIITAFAVIVCAVFTTECSKWLVESELTTDVLVEFDADGWTSETSTPLAVCISGETTRGDTVDRWLTFDADDISSAKSILALDEGVYSMSMISPIRSDGAVWELKPSLCDFTVEKHSHEYPQIVRVVATLQDDNVGLRDAVVDAWLASDLPGGVKSDIRELVTSWQNDEEMED